MKQCPFCAEPIQDAAVVCKHCGRDLVPRRPIPPSRQWKQFLWGGALILIALAVFGTIIEKVTGRSALNRHDDSGNCVLQARATVVGEDTPLLEALGARSAILAVRSMTGAPWSDVTVTIYGMRKLGTGRPQPTGAYHSKQKLIPGKDPALVSFQLDEFQNADGARWISLTDTVADVELTANVRGEVCKGEAPLTAIMDVIDPRGR